MGRSGRMLGVALVVALVSALLPGLGTAPATAGTASVRTALAPSAAATTGAGQPVVHTPLPRPGSIVTAGNGELRAHVTGDSPIEHADVALDGLPLAGVALTNGEAGEALVRVPLALEAGQRRARVALTDASGRTVEREWSFTVTDRSLDRLAGADRFDTAVALSQATYPAPRSAGAAVIARGDDFADALAGVPLAAAVDGPLLLTRRDALAGATAAELERVLEPGATVHLLGGTAALSADVQAAIEALGLAMVRHGGPDRYATAAAVASALPPSEQVVLASGVAFPDALAASAPAARAGMPVLLTAPDRLPDGTAQALRELAPREVTVVGGAAAIGSAVVDDVGELATVQRVAGPDRYATAVALLEAFSDGASAAALASGVDFPDALAGARHAAAGGQPLLLTDPRALPAATDAALRTHQPHALVVYGGAAAVREAVSRAALRAAEDGLGGPRVTATRPEAGATVGELSEVVVELDRAVDGLESTVYVEVGGAELPGTTVQSADDVLTYEVAGSAALDVDVAHSVRVTVAARGVDGRLAHDEAEFTYQQADPVFATAGPVRLHLPSRNVELVAYHQANHPGAQQQTPRATATRQITLPSRGRETGSRTAADVVADPDAPVLAPVSGRVVRGGSYVLYCDYRDEFVVIDPDDRPGWEVKVLHFHGLQVRIGDRVEADRTVIAAGPRPLPFRSQVDAYTHARNWPHLHVEVVDPTVPTRPGRGC